MKTIQILGTGCAKCNRLADAAEQAARDLGLDYELEKVTDMLRFAENEAVFLLNADGTVDTSWQADGMPAAMVGVDVFFRPQDKGGRRRQSFLIGFGRS